MSNRQKLILFVALTLAVIRFGLVPLIDWQESKKQAIDVQTKQLSKVVPLIESREKLDKLDSELSTRISELRGLFPVYSPNENLRVRTQRNVESLVEKNQINLEVFDWLSEMKETDTGLTKAQFKIDVRGDLANLSRWHWQLYESIPTLALRDYKLRTFTQRGKRTAELSLIMDAFYVQKEKENGK